MRGIRFIFLWKIRQGLVLGYDVDFSSVGFIRVRTIIPRQVDTKAPAIVRNTKEMFLGVRGANIFNLLPESLRTMNTEHVDMFRNYMDVFLSSIPDLRTVTGLLC